MRATKKFREFLGLASRMKTLEERYFDLKIEIDQYISIASINNKVSSMPPKHLQFRVAGIYNASFFMSGKNQINDIEDFLQNNGKSFLSSDAILDFGCGCGRSLIPLSLLVPPERIYGSDIDHEAIHWLIAHYPFLKNLDVNGIEPPTKYADGTFDLIYVVSVFTHLPEEMQNAWLRELSRIMKPGGIGVLTTHGEKHYSKLQGAAHQEIIDRGFHYSITGVTHGLPEFYQTTYHTHDYIRREWAKYFDIIAIRTLGLGHNHDMVLVTKRP